LGFAGGQVMIREVAAMTIPSFRLNDQNSGFLRVLSSRWPGGIGISREKREILRIIFPSWYEN
jgi:hypothetical protein